MDLKIAGEVAMVAAGSRGIGLAAARLLAAEGAKVSICGRDEARLQVAAAEIGGGAVAVRADVSKADELEKWFAETQARLGSPSILVTNTGGPPAGKWSEMSDAQWQEGFDSTLMNVVRMVRLGAPAMIERGWGRIVHVTSLVAREPHPLLPISSTLRAGLGALTRLQNTDLAPHGITVNAVLPGHTRTDRQLHLAEVRAEKEGISPEEALRLQGAESPLGRLAEPEEVAAAIAFLCSRSAAAIGGVSLLVDGGLTKSAC